MNSSQGGCSLTGKTNYHHGDLSAALLNAGEEVLEELGLRGFTLRECARRAGVSHAAPKHHFGDVSGFLTAIATRGFQQLSQMLQDQIDKAGDLTGEFTATGKAYVHFAESYPEHFRIMFRSDLLDVDSGPLLSATNKTFTVLTNVILRQRGEPEISSMDAGKPTNFDEVIDDIVISWCHIHGFAHLKLERQIPIPEDEHDRLLTRASTRLSRLMQNA
jgi:AcrR family transcriptional regulator